MNDSPARCSTRQPGRPGKANGSVAQLGERSLRMREAADSTSARSTKWLVEHQTAGEAMIANVRSANHLFGGPHVKESSVRGKGVEHR